MRGLASKLIIAVVLMGGSTYLASPFWTAWSLREAVRSGDTETLREKVEWPAVRRSLRHSIAQHGQLLPAAVEVGRRIRPTLWQRVKALFGESMLDRFIDRYISAEGLPKLYRIKTSYRTRVQGLPDERLLPLSQRVGRFLRRVKRAEFINPGQVEIEVEDRDKPERRIVAALTLVGFSWKLTGLSVKSAPVGGDREDDEARQYAEDLRNGGLSYVARTRY